MTQIIFDEPAYVKNLYENNCVEGVKPSSTIMYLAKYFIQIMQYSDTEAVHKIDEFMRNNYTDYYDSDWYQTVLGYIKSAHTYPLVKINELKIYKSELETIQKIGDPSLEKLAFTILCAAKYRNIKFEVNTDWCSLSLRDIFRYSNVTYRKYEYILQLRKLIEKGFIFVSLSEKNYLKPTFIKQDGEIVLTINEFKDLGKKYMVANGKYLFCHKCGSFERQNTNKTKKYCKKCVVEIKKEIDRNYKKNIRKIKMSSR